jgi:hypothetical protein
MWKSRGFLLRGSKPNPHAMLKNGQEFHPGGGEHAKDAVQ